MSSSSVRSIESGSEFLVPTVADVIVKYTWSIDKYGRSLNKRDKFDSPAFEYNVNNLQTRWNLAIRYWKGPDGKRIKSPVVLCLNLLSCAVEAEQQARVRFQFGVYNVEIKQWEMCRLSQVVLTLQPSHDILSIGYRDLSIGQRHLEQRTGNVAIFVKLQLSPDETDSSSLAQDLSRLLCSEDGDVTLICSDSTKVRAHSVLLRARSSVFADMLDLVGSTLEVDLLPDVLFETLRYIYTDHVDNIDTMAANLLAAADKYQLLGLKTLCERILVETITPETVASLLLIADQFNCELLKRTLLSFCEDNVVFIKKTTAWKVMELVNPELFVEACEAGIGSSMSSNLDSDDSDADYVGL